MITKKQMLIFSYYLSRVTFLGIGFSLIFDRAYQESWISAILGTIIGIVITFIFAYILNVKKERTIKEFLSASKIKVPLKILIFLFASYFLLQSFFAFIYFINSFFLMNTPPWYIILPAYILLIYSTKKGITNTGKVAESLFTFSIIIPLFITIVLYKYANISYLFPIFTVKAKNILATSISFAVFSTAPYIFLLPLKSDGKNLVKMHIFNSLALLLVIIVTMSVLGRNIADLYRFPEYMVLKRIKIYTFIEKIENLVSVIWIIDLYISMALSANAIKEITNKKINMIITCLVLTATYISSSFIIGKNYKMVLMLYYNTPKIYISALVLILIPMFIYSKKQKKMVKSTLKCKSYALNTPDNYQKYQ